MPTRWWGCPQCGTRYGALLYGGCPRCPGASLVEETDMPKITRLGGASNHLDDTDEGSEQPSPGTSSSASPKTPSSPSESSSPEDHSPAPTTESPSPRRRKAAAGSAASTATSGPATGGAS